MKREPVIFYIVLLICSISTIFIDICANATFDAGDGVQHYLIARYSWQHPELLLDIWGKPFFTLVSSAFAQFGLNGMILFQVLCTSFTSLFCYQIAKKLKLDFAWTIPIFIFFSPVYFATINTGLTEIFFVTLFMFSTWLIFEKKYLLSAIIASTLPFVRPESYIALPLIAIVFIIRKEYKSIPFLLLTTIFYSVVGYFHYKDILWIMTRNYTLTEEGYAGMKGELLHFINHYEEIWGIVYSILLLIGIFSILSALYLFFIKRRSHPLLEEEVLLIYGSFGGFLLLHSLLYWMPGIFTNLGMLRYMTTLIPCSALIAVRGLNIISRVKLTKMSFLKFIVMACILALIIKTPFTQSYYPFRLNNEQIVVKTAGEWIKKYLQKQNNAICYMHPYTPVTCEIDPYDPQQAIVLNKGTDIKTLPEGTLLLWDSHYTPQEGKLPLEQLLNNAYLQPIKHYKYYNDVYFFEVLLFVKQNEAFNEKYKMPETELISDFGLIDALAIIATDIFDFDIHIPSDPTLLSNKVALSGKTALEYTSANEFGPVFSKKTDELKDYSGSIMMAVSFNLLKKDSLIDVTSVIEIKKGESIIAWYGQNINKTIPLGAWQKVEMKQILPVNELNKNNMIRFYFWNKGKNNFYIDDVKIDYLKME